VSIDDLFFHTQGGVSVGEILVALLLCFAFATLATAYEDRQTAFPDPEEQTDDDERFWAGPRR
jgi:hypothetical protein